MPASSKFGCSTVAWVFVRKWWLLQVLVTNGHVSIVSVAACLPIVHSSVICQCLYVEIHESTLALCTYVLQRCTHVMPTRLNFKPMCHYHGNHGVSELTSHVVHGYCCACVEGIHSNGGATPHTQEAYVCYVTLILFL